MPDEIFTLLNSGNILGSLWVQHRNTLGTIRGHFEHTQRAPRRHSGINQRTLTSLLRIDVLMILFLFVYIIFAKYKNVSRSQSVSHCLYFWMDRFFEAWWKIAKTRTFARRIFKTEELLKFTKQLPFHKREVELGPQKLAAERKMSSFLFVSMCQMTSSIGTTT